MTIPEPRSETVPTGPTPASSAAPVERKVVVASVAAFLSSEAVSELAALLGHPVSDGWSQLVTAAVTGLVTFVAAWLTKHTPRT
jgi:hypothetical protein